MAQGLVIKIKNTTGSTLEAGKVVRLVGLDDEEQLPTVDFASNDSLDTLPAIGVVSDELEDGASGNIRLAGMLAGVDTSSVDVGDSVWVGSSGELTFDDPAESSNISQQLGVVALSAEDGQILLLPMEIQKPIKHTDLEEVLEDQHHEKLHAGSHRPGGEDELGLSHSDILGVTEDQHHPKLHASTHVPGGGDEFLHAAQHAIGGGDPFTHSAQHSPGGGDDISGTYLLRDGSDPMTGNWDTGVEIYANAVGIGTTNPGNDAALEIVSTTKGLLMPRMTAAQAGSISSPTDGLIVYVTTTDATFLTVGFYGRQSGAWAKL